MNKIKIIFAFNLLLLINHTAFSQYRVIISSDFPPFSVTNSNPDDVQSMVRFLLYSNEFDIEGLIASAGVIEGDSPSFLYLVSANRGINNPEDPTQPSWGGQYIRVDSTNH